MVDERRKPAQQVITGRQEELQESAQVGSERVQKLLPFSLSLSLCS